MTIYGKIKEREGHMNRLFLRERDEQHPPLVAEKIKIGVAGMCQGAGVTVIGTTLAKIASKNIQGRVKFLEIAEPLRHKPMLFDSLGMDKRFAGRDFFEFYSAVSEGRPIRGKVNIDEGISWALITNSDLKKCVSLTREEKIHLINNTSCDILVCDINCNTSDSNNADQWEALVNEMDLIIFVIDPMPSRLLAGFSLLNRAKALEEKGKKIVWVINKFNDGINKKECLEYLRIKIFGTIPLVQQEKFYTSEYNCRLPYHLKELHLPLAELAKKHEIFT